MPPADSREKSIKDVALETGFSTVGIAALDSCEESNRIFADWLRGSKHGDMRYLSRWKDRRENPRLLLQGAKSAICVGLNYYSPAVITNRNFDRKAGKGIFSIYSRGRDYHSVMGEMLATLASRLERLFPEIKTLACVDTKPVSDRTLAIRSGIAWLGKNSNVISPMFGSWIFLGSLLTDLELAADAPLQSRCGDCTLCIDSCPSGAIEANCTIDAGKCVSYLTVEKRGEIAGKMRKAIGIRVFGCDTCQYVCPYNDTARESSLFSGAEVNPLIDMRLTELMNIDNERFDEYTRVSVIRRCGVDGMRRNAKMALDNSNDDPSA